MTSATVAPLDQCGAIESCEAASTPNVAAVELLQSALPSGGDGVDGFDVATVEPAERGDVGVVVLPIGGGDETVLGEYLDDGAFEAGFECDGGDFVGAMSCGDWWTA